MKERNLRATTRRLERALGGGAGLWLVLLVIGFLAPGGWHWGWPGAIGHMINYMISLWIVTLVLAPLIAMRDPLRNTATIQVYFFGLLAIVLSAIRGERLELLSDAPPIMVTMVSFVAVVWAHPYRSQLWGRVAQRR